jgi:hypothetical protein
MVDREELRQLVLGQFYMPMSPAKRQELRDGVLALLAERDQLRAEVMIFRGALKSLLAEADNAHEYLTRGIDPSDETDVRAGMLEWATNIARRALSEEREA